MIINVQDYDTMPRKMRDSGVKVGAKFCDSLWFPHPEKDLHWMHTQFSVFVNIYSCGSRQNTLLSTLRLYINQVPLLSLQDVHVTPSVPPRQYWLKAGATLGPGQTNKTLHVLMGILPFKFFTQLYFFTFSFGRCFCTMKRTLQT